MSLNFLYFVMNDCCNVCLSMCVCLSVCHLSRHRQRCTSLARSSWDHHHGLLHNCTMRAQQRRSLVFVSFLEVGRSVGRCTAYGSSRSVYVMFVHCTGCKGHSRVHCVVSLSEWRSWCSLSLYLSSHLSLTYPLIRHTITKDHLFGLPGSRNLSAS